MKQKPTTIEIKKGYVYRTCGICQTKVYLTGAYNECPQCHTFYDAEGWAVQPKKAKAKEEEIYE